ncbi:hypothetical protein B0J13DRAFT_477532 [Dactylonectria estremocensis]|uniref:Ketoreductase (KR) domain-containing protein n=1 Tax=Dactylonectria estremocensis TaxID=1079267 RepID=A0A9P9ENP2_9HYPO|nr:hypothetical protein B0J13DRAFT_477532 [Dactylonectria estremocensis]
MVAISIIKESNTKALPSVLPSGLVAVFLGGTSGIGQATLKQFIIATKDKSPRVYIVGRSTTAAHPLLAELRQLNPSASLEFIQQDVSLVRNVDAAVSQINQHENKVDLLFMSVGFVSFQGRKETTEGLEPSMTTRYYSRARAIQLLLPLLNRSENPHVVNILAAGQEAPLLEDDLDLRKPGNFSVASSSQHATTMLTLMLERWAAENPNISFVHQFPGLVATPILTRGSSGITGFLLRWVVSPIINAFVAASPEDAGARSLFHATNARYTVPAKANRASPIPEGLERAGQSGGGVFQVSEKSEYVDNEKVLVDQRRLSKTVWEHTQQIYARVT